ncbi:MAG: site-specific DNA-methyltransferase [Candidatus Thorarchaeota archaeon]
MGQSEKLFFDRLKDIFVGAKIEGESGFINLMRIKSAYFDSIFRELCSEIDDRTREFPEFREEMFRRLYDFFKTYFSESGSIYFSYTPLKSNLYERVYTNQKDVALFWKTHMLYYVKTDRLWHNLNIEFEEQSVRYRVVFDVSRLEHKRGNEKRLLVYELKSVTDREIVFSVLYSERGRTTRVDEILRELKRAHIPIDDERLGSIFRTFEKQNEVDFFINKNARAFLKEQFDLWLKNYLFDDESDFSEKRLRQLKTLKDIAHRVIDFVAQFEDELVKIWNKPKFVLNSNYVITLDKIAERDISLVDRIVRHRGFAEQEKEWRELGLLEEFDRESLIVMTPEGKELNREYRFLPIDTKYFDQDIKSEILSLFDDLDEELDGWLIHSENYQALRTILPKFRERVQTIYIDPPFNLGTDADFLYNVNYKDANWITLLENRIVLAREMLCSRGSMFVRCDYNGNMFVRLLMNQIFGEENFRNEIVVSRISKQDPKVTRFNAATDSLYLYSKSSEPHFSLIFKRLPSPRGERWHAMDSQGQGQPLRIFGYLLEPPRGRHWTYGQSNIEQMEADGKIRIVCRECGRIHTSGSWSGCPDCGNRDRVRVEYLLPPTEEKQIDSNWTDIPGYSSGWNFSTENSEILLKRVIESTSDRGDLVLDFFLGSGTTVAVAHKLGRKWIGIEMGEHLYSVVLPRMKRVLAYDRSGISTEKDVRQRYNENAAGGFFKYYDLEQYEQTLRRAVYRPSDPLVGFSDRSIYQQYVFLKDLKLLEAMEIDERNDRVTIDLSRVYPNIDVAETLSNLTGKGIKKIERYAVVFKDGQTVTFEDLDFRVIRPLLWW